MLQSAPLSGARERVLYVTAIAASANVSKSSVGTAKGRIGHAARQRIAEQTLLPNF
jgi:hypothetical protein